MKKSNHKEPSASLLTDQMDVDSQEFKEFQAILLNKAKAQSEEKKRAIELLALKFEMEDYLESEQEEVTLAGDFLRSFLKAARVRQNKFASYVGLQPSNLNKVLGGERPISHELALILGNIFSVEPLIWLKVQAKNELKKMAQTNKQEYTKYSLDDLI